jgi:hypothetical protein
MRGGDLLPALTAPVSLCFLFFFLPPPSPLLQDDVVVIVAELLRTSEYDFEAPIGPESPSHAAALRTVATYCQMVLEFATSPVSAES